MGIWGCYNAKNTTFQQQKSHMADTVLYMRMPSSAMPQNRINDKVVDDLRHLVQISPAEWDEVTALLNSDTAFGEREFVDSSLQIVTNEDQRRSLKRLISWTMHEGTDEPVRRALDLIKKIELDDGSDESEGKQVFNDEQQKCAADRVDALLSLSTLRRQAKAERLTSVTGQKLKSLDLVCDLRPVFNEPRTRIEGLIPMTTLRVTCEGVDGLPVGVEAIMSVKDLNQLAKSVQYAQAKLRALEEFIVEAGSAIPSTELTRQD